MHLELEASLVGGMGTPFFVQAETYYARDPKPVKERLTLLVRDRLEKQSESSALAIVRKFQSACLLFQVPAAHLSMHLKMVIEALTTTLPLSCTSPLAMGPQPPRLV